MSHSDENPDNTPELRSAWNPSTYRYEQVPVTDDQPEETPSVAISQRRTPEVYEDWQFWQDIMSAQTSSDLRKIEETDYDSETYKFN